MFTSKYNNDGTYDSCGTYDLFSNGTIMAQGGKQITIAFSNPMEVPKGRVVNVVPHEWLLSIKTLKSASVLMTTDTETNSVTVKLVVLFNMNTVLTTVKPLMKAIMQRA